MDQARLRPAQVGASTAAAVGGAFMASRLGVYGTIIGVGVITLMSTVGSEMLLRSLERTKQAAWTANPRLRPTGVAVAQNSADDADTIEQPTATLRDPLADTAEQPTTATLADPVADTAEQPTTAMLADSVAHTAEQPVTGVLPDPVAEPDDQRSTARRWPLVAGGFLASFGLALAVIAGIEEFTGESLDGDGRPTVVNMFRGGGQDTDDAPSSPVTPTSDESTGVPEDDDGTLPAEPDDATEPRPDPATSPSQNPPPSGEDESAQRGEETPPPDDETTPSPDEETTPDEEETNTPPPAEEETTPPDDDPTPEP